MTFRINSLFSSLCYRIGDIVIDPGDVWEGFIKVDSVLLTHAHFDHIYGLNELLTLNPDAKVYTNEFGRYMLLDDKLNMSRYNETPFIFEYPQNIVLVEDGEMIKFGDGMNVKSIFTPGHNESCITWVIGDKIFTGDSYIPGVKTITNLPGGNKQQALQSETLIKNLVCDRRIYPGHKV